jgi:hypothetical protein
MNKPMVLDVFMHLEARVVTYDKCNFSYSFHLNVLFKC